MAFAVASSKALDPTKESVGTATRHDGYRNRPQGEAHAMSRAIVASALASRVSVILISCVARKNAQRGRRRGCVTPSSAAGLRVPRLALPSPPPRGPQTGAALTKSRNCALSRPSLSSRGVTDSCLVPAWAGFNGCSETQVTLEAHLIAVRSQQEMSSQVQAVSSLIAAALLSVREHPL